MNELVKSYNIILLQYYCTVWTCMRLLHFILSIKYLYSVVYNKNKNYIAY